MERTLEFNIEIDQDRNVVVHFNEYESGDHDFFAFNANDITERFREWVADQVVSWVSIMLEDEEV